MRLLFLFTVLLLTAGPAVFAQSLTIQGKVTDANGQPVSGNNTQFRVQILSPDTAGCVLYDETFVVDLSTSYGLFSLNLNGGTGTRNAPNTYTLDQAISNRASFAIDSSYCKPGSSGTVTYVPSANDKRRVLIKFRDPATMTAEETIPEMDLNPVAYAMEARSLGGFPAASVLRVQDPSGPAPAASFSSTQFADLQALVGGTSTKYMVSGSGSSEGARLPTVSGRPATPTAGSVWYDTASGTVKYFDGSADRTVGTGTGSGTITGVTAGTGLSGGGASGSVTLSLSPSGVGAGGSYGSATQVPQLTVDTYGRITGITLQSISGTVPGAGASGQVLRSNGTSWTSDLVRTGDIRSTSDNATIFPASSCTAGQSLGWDSVSDKLVCQAISLPAPSATVAASYSKVNVAADGRINGGSNPTTLAGYGITDALDKNNGVPLFTAGNTASRPASSTTGALYVDTQALTLYRYNGTAWDVIGSAGAGGSLTGVTAGTGLSGGGSSGNVTVSMPNVGTAGTYFKVTTDAQGRVTAGSALVDGDIPSLDWTKIGSGKPTTLAGYGVTDALRNADGSVPSISSGTEAAMPSPVAGNLNHLYIANDTKKIFRQIAGTWEVIGAAPGAGFTGSLAGEVSGTQGATQVASINGITRATITANLNTVSSATELNTASSLVKRDASGNFAAGAITATDLNLKNGANAVNVKAASGTAAYNLQLPATAPAAGQSLQSDASGVLSWVTAAAGSLTNILNGTGITVTGSGATRTVTLADTAVTPNSYGSATQVPTFTVDQQGRLTAAANVTITGTTPGGTAGGDLAGTYPNPSVAKLQTVGVSSAAPSVGQVLKYVSSNWAASTLELNDLKALDGSTSVVNSAVCTASQTMYYDTGTKSLRCMAIGSLASAAITDLDAAKLTGTIDPARLPVVATLWAESSGNVYRTSGNVFIGTSSGSGKLTISSAGNQLLIDDSAGAANSKRWSVNAASGIFRLQAIDDAGVGGGSVFDIGRAGNEISYFKVGGSSPALYADVTNGRVGIGTSAPASKLHVLDAGAPSGVVAFSFTDNEQPASLSALPELFGGSLTNNFQTGMRDFALINRNFASQSGTQGFSFVQQTGTGTFNTLMYLDGDSGHLGIGTTQAQAGLDVKTTGTASAIIVPRDTVANRPTGVNGMIRYATDTNVLEAYVNGAWASVATIGGTSSFTTVNSGAGSAAAPSISFSGDTNTGFYNSSSNDTISVATGGTKIFDFSSAGISSPTTGGASVLTANGSAAAPTYSFAGDLDTGWFRPAADTMAASTAGAERMRIDSTGKVGVNGTHAYGQFSVFQTAPANTIAAYIESNPALTANSAANYHGAWSAVTASAGANTMAGLYAAVNRATASAGQTGAVTQLTGTTSDANNTGAATITAAYGVTASASNSGTGTITNAYGAQVAVGHYGGTITNAYGLFVSGVQGTNKWSVFANDASAPSYFAGNIGIGTSAPISPLSVQGAGGASFQVLADSSELKLVGSGFAHFSLLGAKTGHNYFSIANTSAGPSTGVAGADLLTILPSGEVGIGTTAPTARLHVANTAGNSIARISGPGGYVQDIQLENTTNGKSWALSHRPSSESDNFGLSHYDGSAWTQHFNITTGGNIGIGTANPGAKLDIVKASTYNSEGAAGLRILSSTTMGSKTLLLGADNTSGISYIQPSNFGTNWGAPLALNPMGGNVGIGSTSPQDRLDVAGKIRTNDILDTVGNFHLDTAAGFSTYLNWFGGSGLYVGNGTGGGYGPVQASAFNISSDRSLKTNIKDIDDALERINRLHGVRFDWIDKKMGKERQVGVIAQDVQAVFPELVTTNSENKKLTVNYSGLVSPLIEAVKSLYAKWLGDHARIDALEKNLAEKNRELASVKAKAERAEAEAAALKARMDRLERLLEKK